MMTALLAGSVRLNASPIACPDKVSELIHGELVMVAVSGQIEAEALP
jgi:hypothetical protein